MIAERGLRALTLIIGSTFPAASPLAAPPEPGRVEVLSREAVMPDPGIRFSYTLDVDSFRKEPAPEPADAALEAALNHAREAMAAGRIDEAVQAFVRAANDFPDDPEPASRLCQALVAFGDAQTARGVANSLMKSHPARIEGYVCHGAQELVVAVTAGDARHPADRLRLAPIKAARWNHEDLSAPLEVLESYLVTAATLMEALSRRDREDGSWSGLAKDHPLSAKLDLIRGNMETRAAAPDAPRATWAVLSTLAMLDGNAARLIETTEILAKRGAGAADLDRSLFVLSLMDRPELSIRLLEGFGPRFSADEYQRLRIWLFDKLGEYRNAEDSARTLAPDAPYRATAMGVLALRTGNGQAALEAFEQVGPYEKGRAAAYYRGLAAVLRGDDPTARKELRSSMRDAYFLDSAFRIRRALLLPER